MQASNADEILRVNARLQGLAESFAFLGGAVLGLLIEDRGACPIRTTKDVDAVVDVATRTEYAHLEESLRMLGFRHDTREDAPICRWLLDEITVDIVPTAQVVFGWKSAWLREARQAAVDIEIKPGQRVPVVTPPFFLAAKIEAFKDRGEADFRGSVDLEDIVTVVDGRPGIVGEIAAAPPALRSYLRTEFTAMLRDRRFVESLPGHLPPDRASQERLPILLRRFQSIAELPA